MYNRASTVISTLDSVRANSYRPIELIIVDDGSTDNSVAVATKYQSDNQAADFSIIVVSQNNGGAPSARNHGLRLATGSFVQFLDSDDLIAKTKFIDQLLIMRKEESDVCVCDFQVDYIPRDKDSKKVSNKNPLSKVIKGGSVGCSTCLMKYELATAVTWTESLPNFQDMDYFLKIILLAKKITYLPEALYFYQIRQDLVTISSIRKKNPSKVPYRIRLSSLMNDGIRNKKYGSPLKKFTYGTYAYLLLWLKSLRHTSILKKN